MRAQDRVLARRQLDKRLIAIKNPEDLARPPRGWVKAIREALGMTASQLGARLGVSQVRALALEKGEVSGSITLASLERAAHALDCRLVYALVPRKPLEELVEERAANLAGRQLQATRHTMALESQSVDAAEESAQFKRLKQELIDKAGSALWEEQ
ncbi:mobile mystery protein A [Thioalkalivibrio sp. XN279]|uniref:mobile mystery protein A n=1 Tax=Thioalkalivibrio sp. XN279 TaxID=2714953 RepID=UPI001407F998|nr:mobile mystery protein A [Thioalkalivibrio sp. XN279]NHA14130.1 mobile mystery protein A [Thioalkalivibrio sp. XN279]